MARKKSTARNSKEFSSRFAGGSLRTYAFAISLVSTILWAFFGLGMTNRMLGGTEDSSGIDRQIDRLTASLMKDDPVAAAEITKLRENREVNRLGLVNSLLIKEQMGGSAAMRSMLVSPSGGVPSLVRLCSLGADAGAFANAEKRKDFFDAHLTFLDLMERAGASSLSANYVEKLAAARKDPALWPYVADDALAMIVFEKVTAPDLRAYYVRERENEWLVDSLMETLAAIALPGESTGSASEKPVEADVDPGAEIAVLINDFLRLASRNEPTFAQAMKNPNFSPPLVFQLFAQFGDIIHDCVKQRNLPLDETIEIVFANQDYFAILLDDEKKTPKEIAAKMARIRNGKPNVWQAAKREVSVLRLENDVPDKANRILQKFPANDIATFLYTGYEDEILYAADAIDKFGDLGLYILSRYRDTTGFKNELKRDARIVPYIAQFGNEGLERLSLNQGWMDKYFTEDGKPREAEWWSKVPIVGAPANVVRNWSTGTPNEWSELGWAALDVADAALLIATLGSSSALTGTAKQAAKTGAKKAALKAGEAAAAASVKTTRRTAIKEAIEGRALTLLAKTAEKAAQYRFLRFTAEQGRAAYGLAKVAANWAASPIRLVMTTSKKAVATWKSLSPLTKRIVYGSMLASGLYATVAYRTAPMLKEKLTDALEAVGRSIDQIQDNVKKIVAGDFHDLAKYRGIRELLAWAMVEAVLIGATWKLRPRGFLAAVG